MLKYKIPQIVTLTPNQHRVVFFWKAKKRIEELAVTTEAALNIQWCKCGAKPQKEKRKSLIISLLRFLFSDPLGARTQDPNIKSVVLYLLS